MKIKYWNKKVAFSLTELLTVMAIISIMMGLAVGTGMGLRPPGSRQGTITQLMQSLEEARMSAIEKGTPVSFAIAGSDASAEKRFSTYMILREQTPDEKAKSGNTDLIPMTRWEPLSKGFFFNRDELVAASPEVGLDTSLPGNVSKVHLLTFGTLGQVKGGATLTAPNIPVVEGVFHENENNLILKEGTEFRIQVARLTGRLQLDEYQPLPAQ